MRLFFLIMCASSVILCGIDSFGYMTTHLSEGITVEAAWYRSGAALSLASYCVFKNELNGLKQYK